MTNVIGYNGSKLERTIRWNYLLNYKQTMSNYKNSTDDWRKTIAKNDEEMYKKHLTAYIRKAA